MVWINSNNGDTSSMTQPQIPEELIRLLTAEPIKPSKKQWLGSAIGAILFPRGAGAFLTSPIQWAQTQAAIRQSQAREALNALLKIAGLNVEQMKATAPVEAARVREEGATARQREQMEAIEKPKLSLEERRLEEIEKPRRKPRKRAPKPSPPRRCRKPPYRRRNATHVLSSDTQSIWEASDTPRKAMKPFVVRCPCWGNR